MWNPDSLQDNQWLHHHQIVSASRFVPAVMFTSEVVETLTVTPNPVVAITSITAADTEGVTVTDVTRGEVYQFTADVDTTLDDGTNEVVRWELVGAHSALTYVTREGVLHVGGTEAATSLTVRATTVWIDPEGVETAGETLDEVVTVSGEKLVLWPVPAPSEVVPVITGVSGSPDPAGEGEIITIVGSGFGAATAVTIGGTAATDFTIESTSEIAAVLPAGTAGAKAVIVTNGAGASAAFNYTRAV